MFSEGDFTDHSFFCFAQETAVAHNTIMTIDFIRFFIYSGYFVKYLLKYKLQKYQKFSAYFNFNSHLGKEGFFVFHSTPKLKLKEMEIEYCKFDIGNYYFRSCKADIITFMIPF